MIFKAKRTIMLCVVLIGLLCLMLPAAALASANAPWNGLAGGTDDPSAVPMTLVVMENGIETFTANYDLSKWTLKRQHYSVRDSMPANRLSAAEGVFLTDLLDEAGIDPDRIVNFGFTSTDNFTTNISKNVLLADRYYYPNIFGEDQELGAESVKPMLALKSYVGNRNNAELPSWDIIDDLNTVRLFIGQTDPNEVNYSQFAKWICKIEVELETIATEFPVTLVDVPDLIWTVTSDKASAEEGETVTVTVADTTCTSWATGLTVTGNSGTIYDFTTVSPSTGNEARANDPGVYSFVMPAESVTVGFTADYTPLDVYVKLGDSGEEILVHSFTREEIEFLAEENIEPIYYTTYDRMPTTFMGKAVRYVTIQQIVESAKGYNGVVRYDDSECCMTGSSLEGWTLDLPWDYLMGVARKYYASLGDEYLAEENRTGEDKVAPPALAITGWAGRRTQVDGQPYDTLNAYRFFYGQSEEEYGDGIPPQTGAEKDARCKANDFAKFVNKLVFVVPENVPEVAFRLEPLDDAAYVVGKTEDGLSVMTVNPGLSGLKYFGVEVTPVTGHEGVETVVFVHSKNGVQHSINATRADFELVPFAQAGFNVGSGDQVKVFIVDELTNAEDHNPVILQ